MRIHAFVVTGRQFLSAIAVAICAALGGINPWTTTPDARADDLRIAQDTATVSVFDGGRPVLHYRYADVPRKPCADMLFTPSGVQVLRDSPMDHVHHHGLMYALAIDGVSFWEEGPNGGAQRHRDFADVKAAVQDGRGLAGFVETLDWLGPDGKTPMLAERRAIEVVKQPGLGATLLNWRCRLAAPQGKPSVVLSGSHYYGLGMRFLNSMDAGGRFSNADDRLGEVVRGTEKLTPAKWCAYTAKVDGLPVTVALFDHPKNLRHPAKMFTMTEPFAYLAATFNEWKEPVTLVEGKPLEFVYGVALWDGEASKETVEKLYQRWLTTK